MTTTDLPPQRAKTLAAQGKNGSVSARLIGNETAPGGVCAPARGLTTQPDQAGKAAAMQHIPALPMDYRGVTFRSTLEADWAANLDILGITWSYEPWAVQLRNGIRYLADFHLPAERVWLEVKGPHNRRVHKTRAFFDALATDPYDWRDPLVVIGRAPLFGRLTFHGVTTAQRIAVNHCDNCDHATFVDLEGAWSCRVCGRWSRSTLLASESQTLLFHRAPRPRSAA